MTLTPDICREWVDWLIENRSKAFLEDYYFIKDGRIIGIPQFPDQTLIKTIPDDGFNLSCHIRNTISRINSRALRIAKFIANK